MGLSPVPYPSSHPGRSEIGCAVGPFVCFGPFFCGSSLDHYVLLLFLGFVLGRSPPVVVSAIRHVGSCADENIKRPFLGFRVSNGFAARGDAVVRKVF